VIRHLALALGVLVALAGSARANCVLPFTLLNGTLADATQVMGNFNALNTCVNSIVGNQIANTVLAGPTSGGATTATFRKLIGADLPNPAATTLGGIESLAAVSHKWINTISTSGVPGNAQPGVEDLSDPPQVMASFYGVTTGNSAATNTTNLNTAAAAAYNAGLPLNLCISGASTATIPTNGSALYGGMRIITCAATTFQMGADGAAFYTMPTPTSPTPGLSYQTPLVITDGLHVDMNNKHGTALLIEGFDSSRIGTVITHKVGTGTWSHDDGGGAGAQSYLDAGITIKTINNSPSDGAYYNEITNPILLQPGFDPNSGPASITGGVGILLTATGGTTGPKPNVTRLYGGDIRGFAKGIFIQAGGDFHSYHTDLSENTYGAVVGDPSGYNIAIQRAIFDQPYLESTAAAPEYIGIWFTSVSQYGRLNGAAGVLAIASCVDDGTVSGGNLCDTTKPSGTPFTPQLANSAGTSTYTPPSIEAGWFDVTLVGGGGAGGGCPAITTGNNCVGGGGAAGSVIKVMCYDPLQMNMRGASRTIGAGGTPGTGSGGNGGDSTLTGAIIPFSGANWTLANWVALTPYTARTNTLPTSFVLPTVGNAGNYEFAAIVAGTTSAGPVTWPQTPGATVVDGTVTWENMGKATWTAGMTAVVDTSQAYPLGTLLGPSTGVNAGAFFYMAVQPGTTGGAHPTWPQKILNVVADNTVIWETVGRSLSLSASGGTGGPTSGAAATDIDISPRGLSGTNTITGCTQEALFDGTPGGDAYFNIISGFGHSGTGGSTTVSRGGLGQSVVNASIHLAGSDGVGPGAGGGGAVDAINNLSVTAAGGAGQDGELYVAARAGAVP
jgi:hypothetical protein